MASSHKLLPVLPFWTPTDLQSCISEFRELYVVTETLFTVFERIAMKLVCLVCGTSTIFVIVERHLQQTAQTCYKLYFNREKRHCSAGNDQILVVKRYFLVQRQILQVNVKLEIYIYTVYRWSDTTIFCTNRGTWLKVSADEQKHIVATRKQTTSAVLWTLFSGGIFCCLFKWLLIFVNYLFVNSMD